MWKPMKYSISTISEPLDTRKRRSRDTLVQLYTMAGKYEVER